jgi:hypothetical protein
VWRPHVHYICGVRCIDNAKRHVLTAPNQYSHLPSDLCASSILQYPPLKSSQNSDDKYMPRVSKMRSFDKGATNPAQLTLEPTLDLETM